MTYLFVYCLILFETKLSYQQLTCSNLIRQIAMDCFSFTESSERAAAHNYVQTDTALHSPQCKKNVGKGRISFNILTTNHIRSTDSDS